MDEPSKYYVATSIPYVNAVPHIGHAYEFVIGDVLSRYHKLRRDEVFFSIGADEHGSKIQAKAAELNLTPVQLVEQNTTALRDLAPALSVEYTKFIRTSDPDHEARAAIIWKNLSKYIYKGKYQGMYDVREETFITTDEAKQMMNHDPARYDRLEKIEEDNYFFKLSAFQKPIEQAIKSREFKVVPDTKRNEMLSLLEQGLQDISVSRPAGKIGWGISVPDDPSQTIYVWFEALMNYITTLGYPDQENFQKFWPCDAHVVGKDIIRFHAIIWPAMLMGLGLKLPKSLYVHGFITINDEKMSKSVGNVISPLEIVSTFGTDACRYYMLRHIPSYSDGDFSWKKMELAYNSELGNELGNLVSRVHKMVAEYVGGVISESEESTHDEQAYHEAINDYRFDKALDHVWVMIKGLNQYIDERKPWQLAKDEAEKEHLAEILSYLSSSLVQLSELLAPFVPTTAKIIYDCFSGEKLGTLSGPLFPRINKYLI